MTHQATFMDVCVNFIKAHCKLFSINMSTKKLMEENFRSEDEWRSHERLDARKETRPLALQITFGNWKN
jgi:hypothetical protein